MKQVTAAIMITLLLVCNCYADELTGNINVTLGMNFMDHDDWEPVDEQRELGINIDLRANSPVALTIGLYGSSDDDIINGYNVELSTSELRVGLKKIWEIDENISLFFSGGIAIISVEAEVDLRPQYSKISEKDGNDGFWIGCGAYKTINNSLNIGAQVEFSSANIEIANENADAGGTHVALIVGYHF